jgi:hypothetical protein
VPAEAIHLSALMDTLTVLPIPVRRALCAPAGGEAVRAGAMFVDLPYCDRFRRTLVRYVLGVPPQLSPWGDVLHQRAPIALCRGLAEAGARLQRSAASREAGAYLVALALGYASHAALDTALHPLVNALAGVRGAALGDPHLIRQHQEVEKFQSVLFHEERHGHDYLGTPVLRDFLAIDWRPLCAGPVLQAVLGEMRAALGEAPEPALLRRWTRGYGTYIGVLGGLLGRRVATGAEKERERPALYDAVGFPGRFAAAVGRSVDWVRTLHDYVSDGAFDDSARAELGRRIPEQSLDPPAPPAEA